jgi:hypothetical protein
MGHKGYYGQYSGNSKFSKNHAHTRVTSGNYKATERDDAAHIDYLKRDIDYDNKHGHSDEKMTADEKHISKLAGDMKYDKEHHSPAKHLDSSAHEKMSNDEFVKHYKEEDHGSPAKHNSASERRHIHSRYHTSYEGDATFPKDKAKGGTVVEGNHGPSRFKKQKEEKSTAPTQKRYAGKRKK